jgi:hypothetical protein
MEEAEQWTDQLRARPPAPLHAPSIAAATARELVTLNTTPNPSHTCHGIGINWWSICSARPGGHGVLLLEGAGAALQYYSNCSTLTRLGGLYFMVLLCSLSSVVLQQIERANGDG